VPATTQCCDEFGSRAHPARGYTACMTAGRVYQLAEGWARSSIRVVAIPSTLQSPAAAASVCRAQLHAGRAPAKPALRRSYCCRTQAILLNAGSTEHVQTGFQGNVQTASSLQSQARHAKRAQRTLASSRFSRRRGQPLSARPGPGLARAARPRGRRRASCLRRPRGGPGRLRRLCSGGGASVEGRLLGDSDRSG
jgi:hypothetical protein